jgi:hypothetical protein
MARQLDRWPDERADALALVAKWRADHPGFEGEAIMSVANDPEITASYSTVARWVRDEAAGKQAQSRGRPRRAERDVLAALDAWRRMYGRLPSGNDWCAVRLRTKARAGGRRANERLDRLEAGWVDEDGGAHSFPLGMEKPELERWIARFQASSGTADRL